MAGLILSSVLSGCTVQDFADFAGNTTSDFFCLSRTAVKLIHKYHWFELEERVSSNPNHKKPDNPYVGFFCACFVGYLVRALVFREASLTN